MNPNRRKFLTEQVSAFMEGKKMNPVDKIAGIRNFLAKYKADISVSELFLQHPELDIRVGPFTLQRGITREEAVEIVLREGRAFYAKYQVFPKFEIESEIVDSGS